MEPQWEGAVAPGTRIPPYTVGLPALHATWIVEGSNLTLAYQCLLSCKRARSEDGVGKHRANQACWLSARQIARHLTLVVTGRKVKKGGAARRYKIGLDYRGEGLASLSSASLNSTAGLYRAGG